MGGGRAEPGDRGNRTDRTESAAVRRAAAARPRATSSDAAATGVTAGMTAGFSDSAVPELQDLLAGAVQLLARGTGASRVAARARRVDGTPYVAASAFVEDAPRPAEASVLDALWERQGAVDLGLPGLPPALSVLTEQHGFGAAAPLFSRPGEPIAVLLLGGDEDPAGRVRPRTLADLDTAVRRLEAPATTAASVQRLGRLDGEVQRLDRLAALGELLSEAVHELRNPLVSFKTFVELSPERANDPEFQNEFRSLVGDEIRRMERLLDNLLRQARPPAARGGAASSGAADVATALESLQQLLAQRSRQRRVAFEVTTEPDLPSVALAEDSLRQVFLNLSLNALDATPEGGAVAIYAARGRAGVEVWVDDQGSGVPHDQRENIFQPFFSTRGDRPGGLGLAISRKLVEEAGGWIEVGDAPSGGARFRVFLPAAGTSVTTGFSMLPP